MLFNIDKMLKNLSEPKATNSFKKWWTKHLNM